MIDLTERLDAPTEVHRMLRAAAAAFFAADGPGRRLREWRGKLPGHDRERWQRQLRPSSPQPGAAYRPV